MARPRTSPPGLVPIRFGGETALFSPLELEELASFPQTEDGEAFARFVHEAKVAFPDSELVPTGPRLALSRYG